MDLDFWIKYRLSRLLENYKKIWKIFYVISSLILFSLFYIYNSLNKIYSIIYQDPFVGGASATQRRGFLAYIKLHMIALKLFLVNFFRVFSQLPYLFKLFYWYSVGGLHYWVIFFNFEFLLSVNGFSVRNTGAETPRRCEQVTPYQGRVCSFFFFFLRSVIT